MLLTTRSRVFTQIAEPIGADGELHGRLGLKANLPAVLGMTGGDWYCSLTRQWG